MAKKEKIGYKPIDNAYTRDIDAWFIVVMTIILPPVGIYLMWARTSWKKWIKITVTTVIVCLFLVKLVSTAINPPAGADANSETTSASIESVENTQTKSSLPAGFHLTAGSFQRIM